MRLNSNFGTSLFFKSNDITNFELIKKEWLNLFFGFATCAVKSSEQ